MYRKITAIVLNVMKYSDKNSIAHVYSDECGRMALLVPQGSTRGARMRNAAFMPLSIVEMEVRVVPGRDIYNFRDSRTVMPLATIYGDPVRSAVAMFVSEFLCHVIQENERNDALFDYIKQSILLLNDSRTAPANFHLCFVYHLGALLGIQPDDESFAPGSWFDMTEGIFVQHIPATTHRLAPMQALALHRLSRITFANMHLFRYNRAERGEIIDIMIEYFRIHFSTIGSMKSPDVLKQLFE